MTEQARIKYLEKLISEKQSALSGSSPDAPAITNIVSQLNALSEEDKPYFKDFAINLKQELFQKNVSIKSLNINQFQSREEKVSDDPTVDSQESRLNEVQTEFTELFKKLTQNRPDHFEILKGYFIVKLENNPLESYKLMVLYDSTYFIQPIKKKISAVVPDAIYKNIKEYEKELDEGQFQEGNLLCLILLHPRANDEEEIKKLIKMLSSIFDSYKYFESYSLKNHPNFVGNYYESSISKEDFFEEIGFVTGTLLSNGTINNEEEKILKKLCSSFRTPLIVYKTIGEGNSGSKVIEVRPKKELGPDHEKRYIIKYSPKTSERKILKEYESFGKFIEGYKGFKDYECKYEKTLIFEGLRYSYAISDTEADSHSYKEIISNPDNIFHDEKVNIVDSLYSIPLFEFWSDSIEKIECTPMELYDLYIDIPKILEQLAKILDESPEQVQTNELVVNFLKIWHTKLKFQQKICHGDLHTENFFKDKNGIYLIDFGYTGIRHAILDHTSLECSIKFKHCPFYVGIEELSKIEDELLLEGSFQLSYKFTTTKRAYLIEMLEMIKKIRNNAVPLFTSNSNTEYLLSLFIMTFRQIRYKDMNQLYAYKSALILSKRLIQLLNLEKG